MDYYYYDNTPNNLENYKGEDINDCVCRAISGGLNIDYGYVNKLLEYTSREYNCPKLCVCCYIHLLQDMFGFPTIYVTKYKTVQDIAKSHSNNIVIIRCDNHLTWSYHGKIMDKFDCSNYRVTHYWIIE